MGTLIIICLVESHIISNLAAEDISPSASECRMKPIIATESLVRECETLSDPPIWATFVDYECYEY